DRLFPGYLNDSRHGPLQLVEFTKALNDNVKSRLEQPALGKGDRVAAGDDEMIQRLDFDQRQRLLQGLGQELVRAAGLGDARRVVVRENDRRCVVAQCRLYDFTRVDAGLGERAAKQL